ncbi:MAG TPA: hypothetical protein VNP98_18345 [Chthoniobacterales bacterium]|nr:hypothetical protein [Chthoniobacterales bacterium]
MPRERKTRKPRAGSNHVPVGGRIVLIDQGPLREAAAAACTRAMARLKRARTGWHRFERKDKPAFIRWRARDFGALLSRAREVEVQIRDSQALVHEVEMEMRRGFQDAHGAYQRVTFRRSNPQAPLEAGAETAREGDTASRKLSEFEKEALFQEWVQRSLGTNPDKMDDEAYSTTFEAFKSHMFRSPPETPAPRNNYRPAGKARITPESEEKGEEERKVDARVKELYRILVRRLHPDLRADASAAVSALWHEVQEAYAASDVPRMEILLALSDIESSHLGNQTSVSQMRVVLTELERALRALEKSLLEAEGEDAWNFAQAGPNKDLQVRVERQLKSELAARTMRLEILTETIAGWARGPIANRKIIVGRKGQIAR